MGTSPDQMWAVIEATRGRLATDVDRLADRTSPRRVARRRTRRMRGAVSGMRERVMGTATYTAHGVRDTAQSAAGSLQEGTGRAVGSARGRGVVRDGDVEIVLHDCPFESAAVTDPAIVCALHLGIAQGLAEVTDGVVVDELIPDDPRRAQCRLKLHIQPAERTPAD